MKNLMKSLFATMLVALFLTSCGSIESDAKKVAAIQCEAQEMAMKALQGDASFMEESQKLAAKVEKLNKEMSEKYNSAEDQLKFAAEVAKLIGDCSAL